ncbi:MAG: RluA family pseudouridine synthase [Chthoniobacterales bacterium]
MDTPQTQLLQVEPHEARQRVDVFLARRLPRLSRSRIQNLIQTGYVLRNGENCRPRDFVRTGDAVVLSEPTPEPIDLAAENISIPMLYEDDHLLVINKPAGLAVHPGSGVKSGTLVNALLFHCKTLSGIGGEMRPGVVHRLDKDTSGCLVVAKHDQAHRQLSRQFARRQVCKYYLALCQGKFRRRNGNIVAPIGRHPVHRQKMAVIAAGKPAHTVYEVLRQINDSSLVLCRLLTGRTHQIRVHLHHLGHPILGDKVYGKQDSKFPRQMLHAWRLGFYHPASEKWLEFEAEVPEDFLRAGVEPHELVRNRIGLVDQASQEPTRPTKPSTRSFCPGPD